MVGREKLKIIIEDPTGNSAIISDKAIKAPLKT
jgi:C4-type Zn-finger protein